VSAGKRPAENTSLAQENASASKRLYVGDTPTSSSSAASAAASASSSQKQPSMSLVCMLAGARPQMAVIGLVAVYVCMRA